MNRVAASFVFVFGLLVTACYLGSTPTPSNTNPPPAGSITFYKDVDPILQQHCQSCHVSGGVAPFPLVTYSDAQLYASDIVTQTGSLAMPPWGARNTTECTTRSAFKNDPSLTPAQIQLLSDWVTQGALEGDIADAPAPITLPMPGLPGVQTDLAPPSPGFTLASGETEDDFECFVLDPNITSTQYINGSDVLPGNSLIVHHAVIFADPSRTSLGLITNKALNSYPCFAGPGITDASLVAAWVPGALPSEFPQNIGMPIAANTLLVMQVHYHPHTTSPDNLNPDITHLQLRYTSAPPQYDAVSKLIGNFSSVAKGLSPGPSFDLPPNQVTKESMLYTFPESATNGKPTWIYSVGGHMHLVGTDVKLTLDRNSGVSDANPAEECLLQIPEWNFYWQRQYDYDLDISALPALSAGDKLTVRCTYDNTSDNAALMNELTVQGMKQPVDVKLGESTLDEMCLGIVTAITPAE